MWMRCTTPMNRNRKCDKPQVFELMLAFGKFPCGLASQPSNLARFRSSKSILSALCIESDGVVS
jgi:hypothetical protein